jgi:hypothetical protein
VTRRCASSLLVVLVRLGASHGLVQYSVPTSHNERRPPRTRCAQQYGSLTAPPMTPPNMHPCVIQIHKTIIGDIMAWMGDSSSVLWFNGRAGAGKAAIGQSLCKRCAAANSAKWLAGNFFFSRHDPGRSNAKFLFPTISFFFLALPRHP